MKYLYEAVQKLWPEQMDTEIGRQTDRQMDRHRDRQTDMTENITYLYARVVKSYPQ